MDLIDQRIKFRHLRAFVEVARRRSVTGAAQALHVSQPAVTKTIRELEETLGVGLFQRDGRGILITNQGEIFLRHAGTAVDSIRRGVDSLTHAGNGAGPPIRVGALPTTSARIMPEAMRMYLEESQATRIKIVTGENAVLLDQLRLGELDLVVGRLAAPEKMTGFFFEHLYSERVVFVVRPGHPLLSPETEFSQLSNFPVLMPTRGSIIRPFVERFLITNAAPVGLREIETVSDSFGRAFTRSCDAIWAISEGVVAQDLIDGALIALPFDTTETQGPVGLTMRTDFVASPGFDLLLVTIRRAAEALRRDPA